MGYYFYYLLLLFTNNFCINVLYRIKSGSPGFLVIYNPTEISQQVDLGNGSFPETMTVQAVSNNLNGTLRYVVLSNMYGFNSINFLFPFLFYIAAKFQLLI